MEDPSFVATTIAMIVSRDLKMQGKSFTRMRAMMNDNEKRVNLQTDALHNVKLRGAKVGEKNNFSACINNETFLLQAPS